MSDSLFDLPAKPEVPSGEVPPLEVNPDDPFESLASDPALLRPTGEKKGFGHQVRQPKSLDDNLNELLDGRDPEKGGHKKKPKAPDHRKRSRAYLERFGYTVTLVETWRTLRSGFACKLDKFGLWDFEAIKSGEPMLYVQVCSKSGKGEHLRSMCSDKLALDNRKKRIDNLMWCLNSGARCVLLTWERQENGRYEPEVIRINHALVQDILSRKRKVK